MSSTADGSTQGASSILVPRTDLIVLLPCPQLSLDLYCTEDEIYELSYTKEPRNPKIQVGTQPVARAPLPS